MSTERRHAIRHRAYLPLRLRAGVASAAPMAVETLTKDISTGGVRCLSPHPLPVASDANLELVLAAAQEPLAARAVVRWFRSLPYSDQFELGLAFEDLSQQSARRLSSCLDRFSKRSP